MLLLKSLSEDLLGCGWYLFSLPCYCLGSLHLVWNFYVTSGLLWSYWAEAKKFLVVCNCLQLQSPGTIDLEQCWWLATLKKLPNGVGLFLFEDIGCGRGLLWLRKKRESSLHLFRGGPRVFGPYQTAWKVSRHHLLGHISARNMVTVTETSEFYNENSGREQDSVESWSAPISWRPKNIQFIVCSHLKSSAAVSILIQLWSWAIFVERCQVWWWVPVALCKK